MRLAVARSIVGYPTVPPVALESLRESAAAAPKGIDRLWRFVWDDAQAGAARIGPDITSSPSREELHAQAIAGGRLPCVRLCRHRSIGDARRRVSRQIRDPDDALRRRWARRRHYARH